MLAPIAAKHRVTVVIEPLNKKDCNVLTTVAALRLLVDAYHLLLDDDSLEDIVRNGDLLAHVHIATVPNRLPPGAEACDLGPFFDALVRAGYDGRVSFEGRVSDPETDLARALSHMRELERAARG